MTYYVFSYKTAFGRSLAATATVLAPDRDTAFKRARAAIAASFPDGYVIGMDTAENSSVPFKCPWEGDLITPAIFVERRKVREMVGVPT